MAVAKIKSTVEYKEAVVNGEDAVVMVFNGGGTVKDARAVANAFKASAQAHDAIASEHKRAAADHTVAAQLDRARAAGAAKAIKALPKGTVEKVAIDVRAAAERARQELIRRGNTTTVAMLDARTEAELAAKEAAKDTADAEAQGTASNVSMNAEWEALLESAE